MNIAELRQEADAGSCVAQAVLGICHLEGIQTSVDHAEAFRLLTSAAAQGSARATANLARMYAESLGVPHDSSKAIALYRQAADAGEFFAQIELGRIYAAGLGVPSDPQEARKWYSAAVAQAGNWIKDVDEPRDRLWGFNRSRVQEARTYLESNSGS